MGCFTVLKSKKKKPEPSVSIKRVSPKEQTPTILPEPQIPTRSLQSAPPSFRTRVKPVQPDNRVSNSRARAMSAPESLDAAEQDELAAVEYDEHEESKSRTGLPRDHPSPQPLPLPASALKTGLKEFINEVNTFASLRHPNLCKLLGYHARDGSEQRMLVYERLYHGSLDRLLYGRSDGPPIDWNTRMKIALCAAQGLTFLHEEGPFQAVYNEFSTGNIQIDKDFSAKLSGYGCVGQIPETEISNSSVAVANLSLETLERGLLTPKSNVWSFGIVLLELLTGRKNLDNRHPKEERNLVKWSRPFLVDDCRLSLIMDPQLKGRFPVKAARTVADIALRCLQKDPLERPTMRTIVEHLKVIQDMKYSTRFPLQEPAAVAGKQMSRSPSLNGIVTPAPRLSFSPSPPSKARPSVSPTRPPALSASLPPRACSSTLSFEELERQESQKSSSSAVRRASVEGF
ncbi:hypothetical protein GH714_019345 [Hevea brasiliensis]|uniref:Protein kinase domain-containing protein n=1 Tax=Hevea brasiliensis TaxID=3981 RepID=A0A6A6M2N0_HEVBR|nr:hypothetical protein GH714_019345 [Hevea brasiliensis]